MGFDEEDELGTVPDDETRSRLPIDRSGAGIGVPDTSNAALSSRVAAPGVAKEMPAASLRGLGAVAPNPDASTADLESRGLESRISPAPIAAPSATQSRTAADQGELERLEKTGSGISQVARAHPIAGGILRGLGTAASVVGRMAPIVGGALTVIPGTEEHHNLLVNEQRGKVGEDTIEAGKEAEAAKAQAEANKANADANAVGQVKPKEEVWKPVTGLQGPNGEPVEQEQNSGQYRYVQLPGVKPSKAPGETQEQNKLAFQAVVAKLDAAGLPTDPKSLDKSLDAAAKKIDPATNKPVISKEEHSAARSYEAANQTPGTNLTVHVAGQEEANAAAINKLFEGKEVLAHLPDGRRVQMSYADAKAQNIPPERLVALSAKEAQDNRDKAASVDTTFKGLDRYRTDFKNSVAQLTDKDRDALRVLAAHNSSGETGGLLAGLIDEIPLAGPMSQYANKLIEGTMTTDQYNQLSPAGKKLVSDYFTTIIDNFANMKAIMGTVGRNPMQLQAEVNTIPVPYLDWGSAQIQFDNKRASLQGRAGSMPELYTPPAR